MKSLIICVWVIINMGVRSGSGNWMQSYINLSLRVRPLTGRAGGLSQASPGEQVWKQYINESAACELHCNVTGREQQWTVLPFETAGATGWLLRLRKYLTMLSAGRGGGGTAIAGGGSVWGFRSGGGGATRGIRSKGLERQPWNYVGEGCGILVYTSD